MTFRDLYSRWNRKAADKAQAAREAQVMAETVLPPPALPEIDTFTPNLFKSRTPVNYRREKVGIIDRRGRYVQRTSAMGEANRNERKKR